MLFASNRKLVANIIEDLRRHDAQLKRVAEFVPVGVVEIEQDGSIAFANHLARKLLCGHENCGEEALLSAIARLRHRHPECPEIAETFEVELEQGSGKTIPALISSSGFQANETDSSVIAIISITDLSKQRQLQHINEEITRLNKELDEKMKHLKVAQDELVRRGRMEQLGQLIATVAHEIRNPLATVRTSAFLLERKLKEHKQGVAAQLERMNNGINRCDRIITQLLDYARHKKLKCEPLLLDSWMAEAIAEESERIGQKASISTALGLGEMKVPFDPDRLHRALINMLNNAAEAMSHAGGISRSAAGGAPLIQIATRLSGDWVHIEVKDNGKGMSEDLIKHAREPLFTTKSFGTGLGVPAIEQIAMQHGGHLEISSTPGQGSSFTLVLPLHHEVEHVA